MQIFKSCACLWTKYKCGSYKNRVVQLKKGCKMLLFSVIVLHKTQRWFSGTGTILVIN